MYPSAVPEGSYFGSRPPWGRFPARAPDPPPPHVHVSPGTALEELTPELTLSIQPQKPELNATVQERQAAEMSKRNTSTFLNRTFSELSENKIDGEGRGGLGAIKQISEQQMDGKRGWL